MNEEITFVKPATPVEPQEYELSSFDHLIPRFYGRNLFFFSTEQVVDTRKVFEHLRQGLCNLLTELPEYAGALVADTATSSLRFFQSAQPSMVLQYRDLRKTWNAGSFAELRDARFPTSRIASMISELVGRSTTSKTEAMPCSDAVVSFIPGGLVLGVGWHHSFTAIEGRSIFLDRWSKHTAAVARGERIEPLTLSPNALHRSLLHRSPNDDLDLPSWLRKKRSAKHRVRAAPPNLPPTYVSQLWHIPAKSIETILDAASHQMLHVTTNDILCALAWRGVIRARKANELFETTMLAVVVDLKQRAKDILPKDYMGNAATFATPTATSADICSDDPMITVRLAQLIRQAIQSIDGPYIEKLLRKISAVPDLTDLEWNFDLSGPALMCTNWTRTTILDHHWGPELGLCAAVRLPPAQAPGTCFLLPQPVDGGVDMLLSLTSSEARALREDVLFTNYANYVCE